MERIYEEWSTKLARDLARAEDDEQRDRIITAALAALLLALRQAGRRSIADALGIALGDTPPDPAVLSAMAEAVAENDRYLETSLIPAIDRKVRDGLHDEDILEAIARGIGAGALFGLLVTLRARVASYAGAVWSFIQRVIGIEAGASGKRITAYLDPLAKHCSQCPLYHSVAGREYASWDEYILTTGGRVPGEFECKNGCRCWLVSSEGEIIAAARMSEVSKSPNHLVT